MDNFWISFCGELDEGYKPDFRISKNKPDSYEGYINIHVYTSDFIEELKAENARYREALEFYANEKDYHGYDPVIISDNGDCAREALKGGE